MEFTFITIHDLTEQAKILYSSDSIVDILGHTPDEVVDRSCWDFFHPDELPLAKQLHNRGVNLDKASVLAYCQLKNRFGQWVGCECCFTVVYDVMVVCTSIYRRDPISQQRADQAPIVRRLFSSSPKDPRYHMLQHLSSKFNADIEDQGHEPRAALFLNRFTRTLTVMYATSGIEKVIGISGEDMKGRSFYECIAPNCLEDAVKCVETAKGNDSIAYLRFRFRDPRQDDTSNQTTSDEDTDTSMTDATASDDEYGGGSAQPNPGLRSEPRNVQSLGDTGIDNTMDTESSSGSVPNSHNHPRSGTNQTTTSVLENLPTSRPAPSTASSSPEASSGSADVRSIELEAVISCTSDGLVVILRRARLIMPVAGSAHDYPHGFFAAPWGPQPAYYPARAQPYPNWIPGMQPPPARLGPQMVEFMNTIREVATFAWALTGINGNLANYTRGTAQGESQPPSGFPVWDHPSHDSDSGIASQVDRHSPSH